MTAEKRPLDQEKLTFQNISSIIVDIEGTTTSISFVHDTLFPYVREHLNEYVKSNWTDSEFQEDLKALKEQAEKDVSEKMEGVVAIAESEDEEVVREAVIKNVLWQMDNDRKTAALKQLQGHIWRKAYEKGQVVGHIYDDVHECLKSWVADGIKVYVYSSGSVEAQKLLFGHTKEGDLLELFSGHFDTAVGAKTEAASYTKIMEQIEPDGGSDRSTKSVLFLTDIPKEAAAAKEAGMQAVLVAREGNAALTDDAKAAFKVINSFADLSFEGNCKRRKVSESDANTNSAVNVDMKEFQDVDMKEAHDESTEQKTGDSTKDENDSAETKMDTSEAVDTEAKDQVCARKPVEATEEKSEVCARKPVEATEEKSEVVSEKSNEVEADKEQTNETASSDTIKSDENSKNSDKIEEPKDSAEKAEVKDENVTDESKKIEENTVEKTENDKVETNDEKPAENTTTEEQEPASDEKASKDVTENGSALEASVEKEKVDTPDDKSAKQEVAENVEMNDDSGIADINKSVNQSTLSEKSDDAKADDNLANGKSEETAAKEGEVETKANGEKDETEEKETTNGKLEETESSDHLKNGESKVNGSETVVEKKAVETNGCVKPAVVGDEVKEKVNGETHDETDKPKTDKAANGNQIAVDENNKAETVTV